MICKNTIMLPASNYLQPFWQQWKINPKQTCSHLFGLYVYENEIEVERLRRAVQHLINNNYNLRSNFIEEKNELKWIIRSELNGRVTSYSTRSPSERNVLMQTLVSKPFNLETDELFRFFLIKHEESCGATLVFIVHHIILDGIQFDVLMQELAAHYNNCFRSSEPVTMSDLLHYSQSEKKCIDANSSEFWIKNIRNYADSLNLPFVDKTTPLEKQITKTSAFCFSPELSKEMIKFCEFNTISVFNVLKILWATLIGQYAARDMQVIVYPTSVRTSPFHFLKGSFVNVLPFALNLNVSMMQQIALEKQQMSDYRSYRFTPTHEIVEKLEAMSIGISIKNIFQIVIAQTDLRKVPPYFQQENKVSSLLTPNIGSATLLLEYQQFNACIHYQINYLSPAIADELVTKLGGDMQQILINAIQNPSQPLNKLKISTLNWHEGLNDETRYKTRETILFFQFKGSRW